MKPTDRHYAPTSMIKQYQLIWEVLNFNININSKNPPYQWFIAIILYMQKVSRWKYGILIGLSFPILRKLYPKSIYSNYTMVQTGVLSFENSCFGLLLHVSWFILLAPSRWFINHTGSLERKREYKTKYSQWWFNNIDIWSQPLPSPRLTLYNIPTKSIQQHCLHHFC